MHLPRGWPRGELFWKAGIGYKLLAEPKLSLEHERPKFETLDEPLLEGHVGLTLEVDAAGFVEGPGVASLNDTVEVRRSFLVTRGRLRIGHPLDYRVSLGVLDGDFYLDSAWIMLQDLPWIDTLKLGAFDLPFGMDNLTSNRDRFFMESAGPVQAFVPDTSPGLQISRTFAAGRGTGAFGIFSAGQRRDVGDQSQSLARASGRVTWLARRPEDAAESATGMLLHLGLAASYNFSGAETVRYQARPQSFLAPVAVDTRDIDARHALLLGTELAGRRGPLAFQGEYLHAFVQGSPSANFPGLYLAVAYLVTGEIRPYNDSTGVFGQVVPERPLDLRTRAFGAFEAATRYSWVELDDAPVAGGTMHVGSIGLNWYWNRYIRWQLDYEFAAADGGALDGRLHIVQARFQLIL